MAHPDLDFEQSDAEVVLGVAAPVGTDNDAIESAFRNYLKQFLKYDLKVWRVTDQIKEMCEASILKTPIDEGSFTRRADTLMSAGNEAREQRTDLLALSVVSSIYEARPAGPGGESGALPQKAWLKRTAHLVRSLKHPDETRLLRRVYGAGYFQFGVSAPRPARIRALKTKHNVTEDDAVRLVDRDTAEGLDHGQRLRDTYELSDFFVGRGTEGARLEDQIRRLLSLVFGDPFVTPTMDEFGMFTAYASSLRSGDLSRQVGAAILTPDGDVVATGANDVTQPDGNMRWRAREEDFEPFDANKRETEEVIRDTLTKLELIPDGAALPEERLQQLADGRIMDLTEFSRPVHAEMSALLACGRLGLRTQGMTLYSTTYPCHNCAKHIIAAGIRRVVFIESYPKSRAPVLYKDYISEDPEERVKDDPRIAFDEFEGVGPRRYFDLFSLVVGSGYPVKRKAADKVARRTIDKGSSQPRIPMLPTSYLQREFIFAGKYGEYASGGGRQEEDGHAEDEDVRSDEEKDRGGQGS